MKKYLLIILLSVSLSCTDSDDADKQLYCLEQVEEIMKRIDITKSAFLSGIISAEQFKRNMERHQKQLRELNLECE